MHLVLPPLRAQSQPCFFDFASWLIHNNLTEQNHLTNNKRHWHPTPLIFNSSLFCEWIGIVFGYCKIIIVLNADVEVTSSPGWKSRAVVLRLHMKWLPIYVWNWVWIHRSPYLNIYFPEVPGQAHPFISVAYPKKLHFFFNVVTDNICFLFPLYYYIEFFF